LRPRERSAILRNTTLEMVDFRCGSSGRRYVENTIDLGGMTTQPGGPAGRGGLVQVPAPKVLHRKEYKTAVDIYSAAPTM